MDEVDKILTKAAKLIKKNGLARGAYARNKNGVAVHASDKKAKTFCVVGALIRVSKYPAEYRTADYHTALSRLMDSINKYEIPTWSDASSDSTVVNSLLNARTTLRKKNSK